MAGAYWKRFVASCINDSSTPSLNRSPTDWARLSEKSLHLLHSCPPARAALLEYTRPIVHDFLQSCHPNPIEGQLPIANRGGGRKRKWHQFSRWPAAETYINELLQNAIALCTLEMETGVSAPEFSARLCLWALDLLFELAPPPHWDVLSTTRARHSALSSHKFHRCRSRRRCRRQNESRTAIDSDARDTEDADEQLSDVVTSSTDAEDEVTDLENDLEKTEPADSNDVAVHEEEWLDLRSSEFNIHLLGGWIESPVIQLLLQIIFSCLMGKWANLRCAQSLITASLPPVLRKRGVLIEGSTLGDPSMCQPHWCTNWLLYQASGLPGQEGVLAVQNLVHLLLEAALRGPPNNSPYNPDYHRSWAVTGIVNTLFLGPSVEKCVANWLSNRLTTLITEQSSQPTMLHILVPLAVLNVRGQRLASLTTVVEDCGPSGFLGQSTNIPGNHGEPWWNTPIPPHFPQLQPQHPHFPPPYQHSQQKYHNYHYSNPAIQMATSLFPDLPTDRPQFRYLHAFCASLRGACLSTLARLLTTLLAPPGKLLAFIDSHLGCLPTSEVDLFKDVLITALFNAPAHCGTQWINLLLNLAETRPGTPKTVVCSARWILKALINRAFLSISYNSHVAPPELDVEPDVEENHSTNFFRALDQLAVSSFAVVASLGTGDGEGGGLMHRLIAKGCYASGQLLLLHSLQVKRYMAQHIFTNIICWNMRNANEVGNVEQGYCPLLLFFPLLRDWERCQQSQIEDGGTLCRSPSEALLGACLNIVLPLVTTCSNDWSKRVLANLLWLYEREEHYGYGGRLKLAITKQLPKLVNLLPNFREDESMSLALNLCELTCGLIKNPLTPAQCVSCARRLTGLLVTLLAQLENAKSGEQFSSLICTIKRVEDLLKNLASRNKLIRTTSLVCFANAAVDRSNSSIPGGICDTDLQQGGVILHQESTCLPTEFLHGEKRKKAETKRGGELLLSCPPLTIPENAVRGAVRGQLIRRQPPPSLDVKSQKDTFFWSPVCRLWVNTVAGLFDESMRMRHLFGMALEDALLPHGTRLPQTCITTLPYPFLMVTPPTGLGLERTLALLRAFVGESNSSSFSKKFSGDETGRRILWGLLELVVLVHPREKPSVEDLIPSDCLPLLPCIRIVIGLLAGFEVQWASSLAPRISVHAALNVDNSEATQLGVFPLVNTPGVTRQRIRKLVIELGHRRLDSSTELYKATALLLALLLQQPAMVTATAEVPSKNEERMTENEEINPYPAPLECLLSRLTPRELATCLSDIRRNLRLRACLDWLNQGISAVGGQQQPQGFSQPPPFLTSGLLIAIIQSHLVESGISDCFGGLLRGLVGCQSSTSPSQSTSAVNLPSGGNSQQRIAAVIDGKKQQSASQLQAADKIEEIDLGKEIVVVLDN